MLIAVKNKLRLKYENLATHAQAFISDAQSPLGDMDAYDTFLHIARLVWTSTTAQHGEHMHALPCPGSPPQRSTTSFGA